MRTNSSTTSALAAALLRSALVLAGASAACAGTSDAPADASSEWAAREGGGDPRDLLAGSDGGDGEAAATDADGAAGSQANLRQAAALASRFVGAAVNAAALADDATYAAVLSREFSAITPENVTKWGPLQPAPDQWDFSQADAVINAAIASGQRVRGHALAWHQQLPDWVQGLSSSDFSAAVQAHIDTTVRRYKGKVAVWDVLNEAIDDGSHALRDTIYSQKMGPGYVAQLFQWAHAADPAARLFYNDYAIEDVNGKSDAVHALVGQLIADGVPIDGVGLQMHIAAQSPPSSLRANIARFAALGLAVEITEMDVRVAGLPGATAAKLDAQRAVYYEVTRSCVEEPGCEAITFWGFTDKYSWVDDFFGADDPLLFDESYQPKPAYDGVLRALAGLPLDPPVAAGDNLLTNPGFEQGTVGWTCWGCQLEATDAPVRSGTKAAAASSRSESWQGPVQDVTAAVKIGDTVSASAWARVGQVASAVAKLTLKLDGSAGPVYLGIASAPVEDSAFGRLEGEAVITYAGSLSKAELYVEGPPPGADLYVDDVWLAVP